MTLRARMVRHRRLGGNTVVVPCTEAREAISARLDGEQLPVSTASLDAHVAACGDCARFEADAVVLGARARLRAVKRVPDDLVAALMAVSKPAPQPVSVPLARRRQYRPSRFGSVRTVQWAAAMLPVLLAAAALSAGAGSQARLVPTRPPTPCTAGLVARQLPPGR
jgi:predicted anti-sigma-YlaC factor YlaD